MASSTIKIAVLSCPTCGAPMRPNPGASAFACPYCDHTIPYSDAAVRGARPLKYKHRVAEMHDGLVKLIRVAVMEKTPSSLITTPLDPERRWYRSFADYVRTTDRRAFVTLRDRYAFAFVCPNCGAPVECVSTQTMFGCEHCGSAYGLDQLDDLGLGKFPQIVGNQSMVPSQCLPFELNLAQAAARIRYLVSQNADLFAGFDVEGLLRSGALCAVYAPAQLADLALRVQTKSSLGDVEFYLEWIDWVYPTDGGLDMTLLDHMAPWDFNQAGPFIPELTMGDTIICASTNYIGTIETLDALLSAAVPAEIEARYGAQRLSMLLWSRDLVKHQSGSIALPVFYLERHDGANGGLRIMVNGQTGCVEGVVRRAGQEWRCGLPGVSDGHVDGERTMKLPPVPVKYVKPSHLYAILPPEQAFKRRAWRAR